MQDETFFPAHRFWQVTPHAMADRGRSLGICRVRSNSQGTIELNIGFTRIISHPNLFPGSHKTVLCIWVTWSRRWRQTWVWRRWYQASWPHARSCQHGENTAIQNHSKNHSNMCEMFETEVATACKERQSDVLPWQPRKWFWELRLRKKVIDVQRCFWKIREAMSTFPAILIWIHLAQQHQKTSTFAWIGFRNKVK